MGLDEAGRIVLHHRLSRARVIELSSQLPACVMAMEACCGAHHLGRILAAHGGRVRLMSLDYVQPSERDAEAIAEAATRPIMRFVDLKARTRLIQRPGGWRL